MTAVLYVHDRFTAKTTGADVGGRGFDLVIAANGRERANGIAVFIHKRKWKCGSEIDSGHSLCVIRTLNVLNIFFFFFSRSGKFSHLFDTNTNNSMQSRTVKAVILPR